MLAGHFKSLPHLQGAESIWTSTVLSGPARPCEHWPIVLLRSSWGLTGSTHWVRTWESRPGPQWSAFRKRQRELSNQRGLYPKPTHFTDLERGIWDGDCSGWLMSKRKNTHITQAKITVRTNSKVLQNSERYVLKFQSAYSNFWDCQMEQRPVFLAILSTVSCLNAHFPFVPVPSTGQREVFTV